MTESSRSLDRTPLLTSVPFWVALVAALVLSLTLGVLGCGFTDDKQEDSSEDATGQETAEDSAGDEVALAYVFELGQVWVSEVTYQSEHVNPQQMVDAGEPETETYAGKERTTAVVEEVAKDGSITLAVTVEALEDTVDGEPQDLEDPVEFEVTVDPTGKVLAVEGFEDAAADAAEDSDDLFDYMDDYSEAFNVCTVEYPKSGTAKIGDEWVVETVVPVPGMDQSDVSKTTYKLSEIRTENGRQVAVITYSGRHTTDFTFDETENMQATMREALGGTEFEDEIDGVVFETFMFSMSRGTGEYLVDLATGIPISASGTSVRDMEMSAGGTPAWLFPPEMTETYESSSTGTYTSHTVE